MKSALMNFAINHPKRVFAYVAALLGAILVAVALPYLAAGIPISKVTIDTDPENMLSANEPVRVLNSKLSERFELHDAIVIAVQNVQSEHGVFTPAALADIASLTRHAATLDGVIAADIVAPGTVELAQRGADGGVTLAPLMPRIPETQAEALSIQDRALSEDMLRDTFVSGDGKAMTLSIPIADKTFGNRILRSLRSHMDTHKAGNSYGVTGLPVAQSVFGLEMFVQMAIAAPAAMALIFGLLLAIFRNWRIAVVPLGVAMVSSLGAMGALVLSGNTVHIMSSMIPIFVMPIAVLDAIHVLSEFADRHDRAKDRRQTIQACLNTLWRPMLFTTITTMAGFASLALAPIPPVQVFGLFVALGVFLAWLATILIVPAALTVIPDKALEKLARSNPAVREHWTARLSLRRPRLVLSVIGASAIALFVGLGQIQINDTPMRWFASSHPVRVAESVLIDRFAGAQLAYLSLKSSPGAFLEPETLDHVNELIQEATRSENITKATALPDLLSAVHGAFTGDEDAGLPDTKEGVARLLTEIENAGNTGDLRKLVSSDHGELVIRFHMANGDNVSMRSLEETISAHLASNPPPREVSPTWFGLTYLNAIWQDRMVSGMLDALIGSFVAVFILLMLLFRSLVWALLAMTPLTLAIGATYGAIGWIGRDFDMPITVLSTLSLGLAVDFAIHFVSRIRESGFATMRERLAEVYREPARAIGRNTVVLGIGFLPLLLSPLIPYRTVGVLIPTIMVISAIATLVLLGAILAWRYRTYAQTDDAFQPDLAIATAGPRSS